MLDTLVGTLLIIILDHLMLAQGGGMEVGEVSLNLVERMAPICGAASWRDEGVAAGPPYCGSPALGVGIPVAPVPHIYDTQYIQHALR